MKTHTSSVAQTSKPIFKRASGSNLDSNLDAEGKQRGLSPYDTWSGDGSCTFIHEVRGQGSAEISATADENKVATATYCCRRGTESPKELCLD